MLGFGGRPRPRRTPPLTGPGAAEPFEHPDPTPEPGLAMRLNPACQPFERPTGTETDPGRGRLASVYNGFDDADPEA